jgi:type IV pilus assembly protein PilP
MNALRTLAIIALGGWTLLGCGSDEPVQSAAKQGAAVAPALAPEAEVAEAEPEEEYRYDPAGKPDPFRSFVKLEDDLDEGLTTPLERFDLSQLEVTAIIWGSDRPRALVRDPAGKGYIVSSGTPIGKNKGRVVSIQDNTVLVKETYVDFRDRATTKEVELRLYENQGG